MLVVENDMDTEIWTHGDWLFEEHDPCMMSMRGVIQAYTRYKAEMIYCEYSRTVMTPIQYNGQLSLHSRCKFKSESGFKLSIV